MQMFINNISFRKNENYFGIVEEEDKNLISESDSELINPIDEAEMFDYNFCMGAWSTDLFDIGLSELIKSEKSIPIKKKELKEGPNMKSMNFGDIIRDREEGKFSLINHNNIKNK